MNNTLTARSPSVLLTLPSAGTTSAFCVMAKPHADHKVNALPFFKAAGTCSRDVRKKGQHRCRWSREAHSFFAHLLRDRGQGGWQVVDVVAQGGKRSVDVLRDLAYIHQEFVLCFTGGNCPARWLRVVPVHPGRSERAGGCRVTNARVLPGVGAASVSGAMNKTVLKSFKY